MADYRKPASALRRAKELYANNNKQLAIETLYDIIKNRRHKTWTATHEEIMKLFILIAVDMRKNTFAKDGLSISFYLSTFEYAKFTRRDCEIFFRFSRKEM